MLQKIGRACASPASNTKAWTSSAYFEQTKLNVMDLKVHHWTHWACDSCPSSLIWFHHSGIWCTTNNKPIVWHRSEAWSISKENLSSLSDLASYPAPDPLPCKPRQYACELAACLAFTCSILQRLGSVEAVDGQERKDRKRRNGIGVHFTLF